MSHCPQFHDVAAPSYDYRVRNRHHRLHDARLPFRVRKCRCDPQGHDVATGTSTSVRVPLACASSTFGTCSCGNDKATPTSRLVPPKAPESPSTDDTMALRSTNCGGPSGSPETPRSTTYTSTRRPTSRSAGIWLRSTGRVTIRTSDASETSTFARVSSSPEAKSRKATRSSGTASSAVQYAESSGTCTSTSTNLSAVTGLPAGRSPRTAHTATRSSAALTTHTTPTAEQTTSKMPTSSRGSFQRRLESRSPAGLVSTLALFWAPRPWMSVVTVIAHP